MTKTYSPKLKDIKRQWLLVDAKGKTLGKLATKLADVLRGKNKPLYSPHLDCGDFVVVINAKEIHVTGKKITDKVYRHHTRHGNGLRTATVQEVLQKKPERVIFEAVAGMIPHSKLKKDILRKLKIFPTAEHKHSAQEPIKIEL